MDLSNTITLRDASATTATLFAFVTVALLIASGTATEDVLAASGLLTEFMGVGEEVVINFTKIGGAENTDNSILMPKQSNVVDARLNLTGSDVFIGNQVKKFASGFDFRQGNANNLIFDTSGLHLDMDTLAPFWPYTEKAVGIYVTDTVTGDFNDDNRSDFVVVNLGSDSVTIYYQDAQGKMATKTTHQTSDDPICVDVGDFNNDDLDDFAVGLSTAKGVDFFIQRSTGGFVKSFMRVEIVIQGKLTGLVINGIATGDLNNDGLDDLALAPLGQKGITLLQSSLGSFSVGQTLSVGYTGGTSNYYHTSVRDVTVGDFNKDGRDDVAWATCNNYTYSYDYNQYGRIQVFNQRSTNTLTKKTSILGYTGCWYIEAGDLNGDGKDDIVISQKYVNKVKVFYKTATSWTAASSLGGDGEVFRPEIADFNSDGMNDLVIGTSKPTLLFYKYSDGKISTMKKPFDLPSGSSGMAVTAGDFNKDGHMDAVVACGADNSVAIFKQRLEYDGSYVSQALEQPLPIRYVNFTYYTLENGGETHFYYSADGGTQWFEVANGTFVDLVERTDTLWFKLTFHSTSAALYNSIKWVQLNMTYQSFPSDLSLDLGRDGSTEWNMSGELEGPVKIVDLEDALTDYIQHSTHYPDEDGYVTIPILISTRSPGTLVMSDLYIRYNNASRRPELVYPEDRDFVNATPTLQFFANDTDDDLLKYKLQITKGGDFNDPLKTMTFDMSLNLFDQEEGEGFPEADFPQGTMATFKVPELYALEDDTTYKWRVFAYDGYLLSKA
ncbi:MAG: VCBS repeat-containing protein, partial [Thermoplasmata archaeon]|nr:VCBS repeat-containing protein [Thermoplasmata archaeon]